MNQSRRPRAKKNGAFLSSSDKVFASGRRVATPGGRVATCLFKNRSGFANWRKTHGGRGAARSNKAAARQPPGGVCSLINT